MSEQWPIKKLGEFSNIRYGYTEKASSEPVGPRFLRITDIKNGGVNWDDVPYCRITDKDFSKYQLEKGDIVFARTGATTGKSFLITESPDAVFASYLIRLQITDSTILPEFVYFYFQSDSYWDIINARISGSAQGGFNASKLSELTIPIPPLEEQQRIVSILDNAFENIEVSEINIKENISNIIANRTRKSNQIFLELENSAPRVEITSVCEEIFAGGDVPKDNYSKERTEKYTVPIIGNAVKNHGLYGYTDKARVTKSAVTIAGRGSGTGHTEIREEPFFPIVRLIVMTPNAKKISLNFLKFSIQNLVITRSGTAIPQLTIPMIKKYTLNLPEIKIQQSIENILNILNEQTILGIESYKNKLQHLEELKQSILQEAFNGNL